MRRHPLRFLALVLTVTIGAFLAWGCSSGGGGGFGTDEIEEEEEEPDPAEVVVGERLFLETRFSQFFKDACNGDVNAALAAGDPTVSDTVTIGQPLQGPFRGDAMNCRACHLVDEQTSVAGGGPRSYGDFARRSPIPPRTDGRTLTPRNSPPLVNASLARDNAFFLHFDGEFTGGTDLVFGTWTGRNFGWLAGERAEAVAHIAAVLRGDDGMGALAGDFENVPYRVLLRGTGSQVPDEMRLPVELRADVTNLTDEQAVRMAAKIVNRYVNSLEFQRDVNGEFSGSPYDLFLLRNNLPRKPATGESALDYARRLLVLLDDLGAPRLVTENHGSFRLHDQDFVFGELELQGLRIFLREPAGALPTGPEIAAGGRGSCLLCHAPPNFTDFSFHNVGVSQAEFDDIHGMGAFMATAIPDLAARNADPGLYLPPSPDHPDADGMFLDIPDITRPGHTDLGAWNVFANPGIPAPQAALFELLCARSGMNPEDCTEEKLLPFAVAIFKTPGLRDLSDSNPYFHTGGKDTLEAVIGHYIALSDLARQGLVRNADEQLPRVTLTNDDIAALAAFLRSLNEDYD